MLNHGNMIYRLRSVLFTVFSVVISFLFISCSSISDRPDINDLAVKAAIKVAEPILEKAFYAQAPIVPNSSSRFSTVNELPGVAFAFSAKNNKTIAYDKDGRLTLAPGDYVIPVMTYCMNAAGISPEAHQYVLSRLSGSMAKVIREINLKAVPKFSPHDVQILSWSIQNGLKYEEMTARSRQIVDEVVPQFKKDLQKSFMEKFASDWDRIADKSEGLIPSLSEASDEFLGELGEVGAILIRMREFHQLIKKYGNDYVRLSGLIETIKNHGKPKDSTSWSRISDNVYARFLTRGSFQEIGQIQIRILPSKLIRKTSSTTLAKTPIDLTSWVADPMGAAIQPLSFSALYGFTGVLIIPELSENPLLLGALLGSVIGSRPIDWASFFDLKDLSQSIKDRDVRQLLHDGNSALSKAHDELEKPAREVGVIDRKTKLAKEHDEKARIYEKPGGEEELEKDFDKFPGEATSSGKPGVEIKTLANGSKVIKRPRDNANELPTLEIQSEKVGNKNNDRIRVKVRYGSK